LSEVTLLVDRVARLMEALPGSWWTVGEVADDLDENTLRVRNVLDGNPERFHKAPLDGRAGYQYRLQAPPPERTHNRLPSDAVITEVEFYDGTTIVPGGQFTTDAGPVRGLVLTVELVDNGAGEVVRISLPNAPEWIDIPTHHARLIKWERR